jgi:hypothetical protein
MAVVELRLNVLESMGEVVSDVGEEEMMLKRGFEMCPAPRVL